MAQKSPLVFVDGGFSQLPPGDSIEGVSAGTLTAGSGLVGGGDLNTGSKRLDVVLTASPSGLIFVGDTIGLDGVDVALASTAFSSGVAGLAVGAAALASGVAAQSSANTALASGNAALNATTTFVSSSSLQFTAASAIASGYAVGLDDAGKVQTIREVINGNTRTFGSPSVFSATSTTWHAASFDTSNNRVVLSFVNNSSYGVSIVGTISGSSITFGTGVVFNSAVTTHISSAFDSANNRIVVSYRNGGGSSYGTSRVGTVSGTSISFGTAVVFNTAYTQFTSTVYNSTDNKIIIAYQDVGSGTAGYAVVGEVSGTVITFGSPNFFYSGATAYEYATYDSTNNRVIIAYRNVSVSNYPTCVVATVSGLSISFGTPVVPDSASSAYTAVAYDSINNKTVFLYVNQDAGSVGASLVGTVSGTSISFGPIYVFNSGLTSNVTTTFDPTTGKVLIAYRDEGNSNYGTLVVGTVSGSSVSYGSELVFSASDTETIAITYASTSNKTVVSYRNSGSSGAGTAIAASPGTNVYPTISSKNNFIGVARNAAASGTPVTVLFPKSVAVNQSGLSTGSFYYVDPTTSGFTTASGQPTSWSGAYPWAPVAKAVSSSGLLLLDLI